MKRCPTCNRDYHDDSLLYCLDDGARLLDGPARTPRRDATEAPTVAIPPPTDAMQTAVLGRSKAETQPATGVGRTPRVKWLAAVFALVIVVAASGFYLYRQRTPNREAIDSVAVLPLENLSGDPAQDYFANGMTEAVIGNLSQIGSIKVISRTSVMKYKNSGKTIPEIAKELGVDGVVEGSVQRSGDRVRINAQLVDAASDSPIWSRSFERPMADILQLESEIAQAVATEISAKLTPAEQLRIDTTRQIDPRATEAFLLGKHYFHMWTPESERLAVENFQKAVAIEPEYADAWAGLSDAWTLQAIVGNIEAHEAEKPTREAAQRALELDPQNSAAHVSMCFIQTNYGFDWAAGENSCRRGIELDPNKAKGHFAYAYLLARLERWDEMSGEMQTAIRLDPAEPWWPSVYGSFLTQAREFDEAEKYLNRAVEVDPKYAVTFSNLVRLYVEQGRFDEALAIREQQGLTGGITAAWIYARKGDRQKALELLISSPKTNLYSLAVLYASLGDNDKAFELINRSLDQGDGFMFGYGSWLDLDRLKSDPRWNEVRRRMNLPA